MSRNTGIAAHLRALLEAYDILDHERQTILAAAELLDGLDPTITTTPRPMVDGLEVEVRWLGYTTRHIVHNAFLLQTGTVTSDLTDYTIRAAMRDAADHMYEDASLQRHHAAMAAVRHTQTLLEDENR